MRETNRRGFLKASTAAAFAAPAIAASRLSPNDRACGRDRRVRPRSVGAGDIADLPHFANFIKAVRSGSSSDLNAGARELHLSASLAHFANISYRTGRMLHFDEKAEKFTGDEEASRLLKREYRATYTM